MFNRAHKISLRITVLILKNPKPGTMSRRIFGKKKEKAAAAPAPTLEQANSKMDSRVKAYEQKIAECDKQLRALKEKIKTTRGSAKSNYERRAMDVLKRKRMYEQQLDQVMAQQFNIEQTAFSLESAAVTVATVCCFV